MPASFGFFQRAAIVSKLPGAERAATFFALDVVLTRNGEARHQIGRPVAAHHVAQRADPRLESIEIFEAAGIALQIPPAHFVALVPQGLHALLPPVYFGGIIGTECHLEAEVEHHLAEPHDGVRADVVFFAVDVEAVDRADAVDGEGLFQRHDVLLQRVGLAERKHGLNDCEVRPPRQ